MTEGPKVLYRRAPFGQPPSTGHFVWAKPRSWTDRSTIGGLRSSAAAGGPRPKVSRTKGPGCGKEVGARELRSANYKRFSVRPEERLQGWTFITDVFVSLPSVFQRRSRDDALPSAWALLTPKTFGRASPEDLRSQPTEGLEERSSPPKTFGPLVRQSSKFLFSLL